MEERQGACSPFCLFGAAAVLLLLFGAGCGSGVGSGAGGGAATEERPPVGADQGPGSEGRTAVLELDVQVYLLHSDESAALTTTLDAADVARVFEGVNQVWSQAGIRWRAAEPVRVEAPTIGALFEAVLNEAGSGRLGLVASILPPERISEGWDVFFIRDLDGLAGGVYLEGISAVVQPEVNPWGIRDLEGDLVRILSHELGHALSLPHVDCPPAGNLMAPACRSGIRTYLTDAQIERARNQAVSGRPHGSDG